MSQKTRPVFIFNLILSLVFPICSALSASDDEVNLSPNFWQQSGEAIFNREYPDGITPRAVILNKMTSSAYREGDTYSVENETGYVALFHEFDPRFVNSPAYTEYNIDHVMIHKSIETHHYLSRMADGLRYEPFSGKILPHIEVLLEEAGLTYRNTIAKTRLISFGDLGESSVYRYAFSQQGGGRI